MGLPFFLAPSVVESKRSHEWIETNIGSTEDGNSNADLFRGPSIFLATSLLASKRRHEWAEEDTESNEDERRDGATLLGIKRRHEGLETDTGSSEDGRSDGATIPPDMESTVQLMVSEKQFEELIPGLPDDITLSLIVPKLSYKDSYNLSGVSSGWQQAIRDHRVYDARVHAKSTETVVAVNKIFSDKQAVHAIALCSMREKSLLELPSIPGVYRGVPEFSQCISLDSKIYVLGGEKDLEVHHENVPNEYVPGVDFPGSKEVYVLDLAGDKRQWKACASMQELRLNFCAAVMERKIYVFGGTSLGKPCGSEVYDPKVDAWSSIKPMRFLRSNSKVSKIGEELYVHGGEFLDLRLRSDSDCMDPLIDLFEGSDDGSEDDMEIRDGETLSCHTEDSLLTEVYRPVKNEWKFAKPFGSEFGESVFRARGRFHLMTQNSIYVHDVKKHLWTFLQSHSFPAVGPSHSRRIKVPYATLYVDDYILALVQWEDGTGHRGFGLLRSRGFRNGNKKIVWETTILSPSSPYPLPFGELHPFNMCTIQL